MSIYIFHHSEIIFYLIESKFNREFLQKIKFVFEYTVVKCKSSYIKYVSKVCTSDVLRSL